MYLKEQRHLTIIFLGKAVLKIDDSFHDYYAGSATESYGILALHVYVYMSFSLFLLA